MIDKNTYLNLNHRNNITDKNKMAPPLTKEDIQAEWVKLRAEQVEIDKKKDELDVLRTQLEKLQTDLE